MIYEYEHLHWMDKDECHLMLLLAYALFTFMQVIV